MNVNEVKQKLLERDHFMDDYVLEKGVYKLANNIITELGTRPDVSYYYRCILQ